MNLGTIFRYLFKPTMEPIPHKIAICVGHSRFIGGKRDGGAVSIGNVSEWDYNRELAKTLQEKLTALGIKSFIVEKYEGSGYTDSMKWLASYLKAEGATHAVELHFNAAGGTASGHEFLYWHSSTKGQEMAVALSQTFKQWFPLIPSRGAKSKGAGDRGAEFLKLTHCPSVILEPGFGDNPKDWAWLSTGEYEIAGAMAQAIKEAIT